MRFYLCKYIRWIILGAIVFSFVKNRGWARNICLQNPESLKQLLWVKLLSLANYFDKIALEKWRHGMFCRAFQRNYWSTQHLLVNMVQNFLDLKTWVFRNKCLRTTYIQTYVHKYLKTYLHTYIHTYILTYTRTYINAYIHT